MDSTQVQFLAFLIVWKYYKMYFYDKSDVVNKKVSNLIQLILLIFMIWIPNPTPSNTATLQTLSYVIYACHEMALGMKIFKHFFNELVKNSTLPKYYWIDIVLGIFYYRFHYLIHYSKIVFCKEMHFCLFGSL